MNGRSFLNIAQELLKGTTSAHWRSAVGRAYYALMLETREALRRWGFVPAPRENVHPFVRLRCTYAADSDLQAVGRNLDWMLQLRNRADYDLTSTLFDTVVQAQQAINTAVQDLPRLDAICNDSARVAAIIADIRARWP